MTMFRLVMMAAFGGAVLMGGCTTSSRQASYTPPTAAPTGVQQFPVPPEGRAVIKARLMTLVGDPAAVTDAKISNAWRTAEGIKTNPNDYAACATATTMDAERTFVIVVSGTISSGYVAGQPAVERCNDPTKVTSWSAFSEMIAAQ